MLSNDFLYGVVPPQIPREVCNERIRLLKKNLDNPDLEIPYQQVRILRAVSFWETLRDGEGEDYE